MRRRTIQPAFALLLTLALVLLAGVALAGIARRSAIAALRAQDALEEFQRRWAVASCRAALVPRAEHILDSAERRQGRDGRPASSPPDRPVRELRVACELAGRSYELVFTDEQAKLNVDWLLKQAGIAKARSILWRLVEQGGGPGGPIDLRLRTLPSGDLPAVERGAMAALGSYGQLFEDASPRRLLGGHQEPGAAEMVTCWGDGTVNVRRAPDQVLEQVCERVLGSDVAKALLAARRQDPFLALATMLASLANIDEDAKATLARLLTDRSRCHGLWVIQRGGQRSWHALAIGVSSVEGGGAAGAADEADAIVQWHDFAW